MALAEEAAGLTDGTVGPTAPWILLGSALHCLDVTARHPGTAATCPATQAGGRTSDCCHAVSTDPLAVSVLCARSLGPGLGCCGGQIKRRRRSSGVARVGSQLPLLLVRHANRSLVRSDVAVKMEKEPAEAVTGSRRAAYATKRGQMDQD